MCPDYDITVIGGGHAGSEAAAAAARMGLKTLLVTPRKDRIGWMSCNPSVGGLAKGHLVTELEALGGISAQIADKTGIQFRLLNRSRGPAVRAPRSQNDRKLYQIEMRRILESLDRLDLMEALVGELILEGGVVKLKKYQMLPITWRC